MTVTAGKRSASMSACPSAEALSTAKTSTFGYGSARSRSRHRAVISTSL